MVIRLLETGGLDTAGTALNIDKLQIYLMNFSRRIFYTNRSFSSVNGLEPMIFLLFTSTQFFSLSFNITLTTIFNI